MNEYQEQEDFEEEDRMETPQPKTQNIILKVRFLETRKLVYKLKENL
jgi:hypothetical protein